MRKRSSPWRRQNDDDGEGYYRQLLLAVCKQYSIATRRSRS